MGKVAWMIRKSTKGLNNLRLPMRTRREIRWCLTTRSNMKVRRFAKSVRKPDPRGIRRSRKLSGSAVTGVPTGTTPLAWALMPVRIRLKRSRSFAAATSQKDRHKCDLLIKNELIKSSHVTTK